MHYTHEIYASIAILALFFFLFAHFSGLLPLSTAHRTPATIRGLLDPPLTSTDSLLLSRACANARLITAFRLTNTFVSPDPVTHSTFLRKCIQLIQSAKQDWSRFRDIAADAVELSLSRSAAPFHTFVGAVTLRTIIVGVLYPQTDIILLAADDVDIVTELITDIWILSKSTDRIPNYLLDTLNTHLRLLIPDHDQYPNPLDFVIPTWETLWRVVAQTLAHVHEDAAACGAFHDLHDNPFREQFSSSRLEGTSPSVRHYITESLRLHPPVKHITRHLSWEPRLATFLIPRFLSANMPRRVEVADVAAAHRAAFWGSNPPPDVYDAARFLREPERARDVLAFGYGRLKCAGMHWAPMAAAVIISAILNRVDGVSHHIQRGHRVGGREGWDGWIIQKVNADT
ncbi:hypothetical protein C8R43DRAFT_562420 [Mycena crocata]|nr:hypothetical protein C8R43DRAFT_562420 [Mycena crocata]